MPLLEPLLQKLRINQVLPYVKPGVVLVDVGCDSPPVLLNQLASQIQYGIGIDETISYRKKGNIETFNQKIIKDLKIESSSADVVTLLAVLEHLKYPQEIIKECYRILKPNGQLLITVPAPKSKTLLELFSKFSLVRSEMINQHENYFTHDHLRSLITNAGFKQMSINAFELGFNTFVKATK